MGVARKNKAKPLRSGAARPRVADLKKQSQHPGAALPACDGCRPKKQSETLAIRSRLLADDGPEKTNQLLAISYQFVGFWPAWAAAMKFLPAQPP